MPVVETGSSVSLVPLVPPPLLPLPPHSLFAPRTKSALFHRVSGVATPTATSTPLRQQACGATCRTRQGDTADRDMMGGRKRVQGSRSGIRTVHK